MADKAKDDAADQFSKQSAEAASSETQSLVERVIDNINSDPTFFGIPDEVTILQSVIEIAVRGMLDDALESVKESLNKEGK